MFLSNGGNNQIINCSTIAKGKSTVLCDCVIEGTSLI